MNWRWAGVVGVLLGLLSVPAALSAPNGTAQHFAQDFYDWYGKVALSDAKDPAWVVALKLRKTDFDPELTRLLKEDADAQAHCGELVGLDFDPILNSQDPADHYVAGKLVRKRRRYLIEVLAVRNGTKSTTPDVTAEFSGDGRHFVFINFHYPDGGDLLSILRSPRPECSVPK
ncbi:MAG TPA: hypothetical protein VMD53_06670 [Rhizomicrobium sp.]|nr:hypothetical protein [Rhizomicrobium sp.]